MICPRCRFEFDDDKLYCPNCGAEVHIVPEYNIMDEDIIPDIVSDHRKKSKKTGAEIRNKKSEKHSLPSHFIFIICFFALAMIALITILISSYMNSYKYFYSKGMEMYANKSYSSATSFLIRAVKSNPDSANAVSLLGRARYKSGDRNGAEEDLFKAYKMTDGNDYDALKFLLLIYSSDGDMGSIRKIKTMPHSKKSGALLSSYVTSLPGFSLSEGEYEGNQKLELNTTEPYKIYYTLDGSDPGIHNGHIYDKPIVLKSGSTIVSAVLISDNNHAGPVVRKTYKIYYDKPSDPVVAPESGEYDTSQAITISAGDGIEIYYTLDGSDPDTSSSLYTDPVPMPDGNNVLSCIAYDPVNKMYSNIVRYNYIYNPQ